MHMGMTPRILVALVLSSGMIVPWAGGDATQPATTAATQPARQTHIVKKGTLTMEIRADGTFQAVEPFEVRPRTKAHSGQMVVLKAAEPWATVKQGEAILELETRQIDWAVEQAENEVASARANLKKAEAELELGTKTDEFALRKQEEALKNAEAALSWWESVDGPQMLQMSELQVKQMRDSVGDQEDELEQLRKMYKSEELTNETADIVVKRALRQLDRTKVYLKMNEERQGKTKQHEYPIAKQRVLDGLETARQQLASLQVTQAHSAVVRELAVANARIAFEQAEQKLADLKSDREGFVVRAPSDGIVLYGRFANGTWQGADPQTLKPGEKITAGQVVMSVVRPGMLYVEVQLPDGQALWVEKGMKARVTPAALPHVSYEGVCGPVEAAPKGNAVVFQAQVQLESADPRLLPGMKASVKIDAGKVEDVLLVPSAAVTDGKVTVLQDGEEQQREVTVGRSDGKMVEVRSGLNEGDEVLAGDKK